MVRTRLELASKMRLSSSSLGGVRARIAMVFGILNQANILGLLYTSLVSSISNVYLDHTRIIREE